MDEQDVSKQKRPILVWIICIYVFISVPLGLFGIYRVYSHLADFPPEMVSYYQHLTVFDHSLTVLNAFLFLVASICLFRLKRVALNLYLTVLVLNIMLSAWSVFVKGFLQAVGSTIGYVSLLTGWCILLAICGYVWKLIKKGIIK
jgi:hypothetical protein